MIRRPPDFKRYVEHDLLVFRLRQYQAHLLTFGYLHTYRDAEVVRYKHILILHPAGNKRILRCPNSFHRAVCRRTAGAMSLENAEVYMNAKTSFVNSVAHHSGGEEVNRRLCVFRALTDFVAAR